MHSEERCPRRREGKAVTPGTEKEVCGGESALGMLGREDGGERNSPSPAGSTGQLRTEKGPRGRKRYKVIRSRPRRTVPVR